MEISASPRASMTRSSTPSKRGQRMTSPGPAAQARLGLLQRHSSRAHQQARAAVVGNGVERGGEHVGAHHHAGAAAGGRVVNGAMAA